MMIEQESKILLVEDTFAGMQYVGSILNDAGYTTVTSLNGNNSLFYIAKEKFDVIILDLVNSELAGYDVLAQIMERGRNADAHVVFLTEGGDGSNLMQGVRYPNVDFVRKPFKREELLARVGNQIAMRRSREESRAVKSLRDSIKYAFRIQKSMLPSDDLMKEAFPNHFIFHKPLDVVSGDFYWAKKIDDIVVFAVADCSGHGVPGAFLSILGISLLNELSLKTELDDPHVIMDNLRHRFKESLERSGIESYFSEGIDMVIGMIDKKNLKMYSAGAFNSIFHSRDGNISEIKGDRQPVGYYPVEKPFKQCTTQLKEGDQLFFCTDGIIDQMGGERGKKLQSRGFSSWLKEMTGKKTAVQKQILDEKINRWMGNYSQIDDILVMGVEI